jgi:hypothetical protein
MTLPETIDEIGKRPYSGLRVRGVAIATHDKPTALPRDIREQIQKLFLETSPPHVISERVRLARYYIIAGAQPLSRGAVGLREVPLVIRKVDDAEAMELALAEDPPTQRRRTSQSRKHSGVR